MDQNLNKKHFLRWVKSFGVPAFLGLFICLMFGSNITAAPRNTNTNTVAIPAQGKTALTLKLNKTGQKPWKLYGVELDAEADTTDKIFTFAEKMPVFPGGEATQTKFVMMNLRYPPEAMKAGITGLVIAQFVVNKKGKIQDIGVIKSVNKELDEEVIRIVKSMPDFTPAQQNGQPVSFRYTLPIRFNLANNAPPDAVLDTLHARIFTETENAPQFPGGEAALQAFIKDNLKPEVAGKRKNAQKQVLTQFLIDTNGKIFYPKVIKSAGKDMDEEALRIVKLIPAFIPAKQNGRTVIFKYTLPVTFGDN